MEFFVIKKTRWLNDHLANLKDITLRLFANYAAGNIFNSSSIFISVKYFA